MSQSEITTWTLQCKKEEQGHTSRSRVELKPKIQNFTTQNSMRISVKFFVIILIQRYLEKLVYEAEARHAYTDLWRKAVEMLKS